MLKYFYLSDIRASILMKTFNTHTNRFKNPVDDIVGIQVTKTYHIFAKTTILAAAALDKFIFEMWLH